MEWIDITRLLHVLGACVLFGTGSGIAFFMLMANRTSDPASVAHTASIVVLQICSSQRLRLSRNLSQALFWHGIWVGK